MRIVANYFLLSALFLMQAPLAEATTERRIDASTKYRNRNTSLQGRPLETRAREIVLDGPLAIIFNPEFRIVGNGASFYSGFGLVHGVCAAFGFGEYAGQASEAFSGTAYYLYEDGSFGREIVGAPTRLARIACHHGLPELEPSQPSEPRERERRPPPRRRDRVAQGRAQVSSYHGFMTIMCNSSRHDGNPDGVKVIQAENDAVSSARAQCISRYGLREIEVLNFEYAMSQDPYSGSAVVTQYCAVKASVICFD